MRYQHQSNYRIINATAKNVGLDSEQVVINIKKVRATAATIPLAMSETYRGNNLKGGLVRHGGFWCRFCLGQCIIKVSY